MKIIKLFLLLSLGLWADISPKTPRCIEYETIKNVLTKGWGNTDQNLTKWVEKDGEKFLEDFKTVIKIPLRPLTNEEYLQKKMDSYEETKKFLESLNHKIRSKEDYKKRQIQLMKYGIYYNNYTNSVYPEIYRYALVMIKYLENQQRYLESFDLYILLLERLINDINVHGKTFLETVVWRVKEEEVFLSLKNSLYDDKYTKGQRDELSRYLSELLRINQNIFVGNIENERKFIQSYLYVEFIENISFEDYMKYDAKSTQKAIKFIDNKLLKQYFEDKEIMSKFIDVYMMKYDVIIHKILKMETKEALDKYVENMPNFSDHLSYTDMTRLFVMRGLDKIGLTTLATVFQYELNENEFIEIASQFFITSGKPWIFGKYKFEWEELVKQNEELLEQSLK